MQKKVYISLILIFSVFLSFSQNPLEAPKIDSVSVNRFGKKATISWVKDTSGNINGYVIICAHSSSITQPDKIDTIKNINTTFYIDNTSKPYERIEKYRIATYNGPLLSPWSKIHTTIYAYISNYDSCNANLTISWNKYMNWETDVKNYKIYYSLNNSQYQLLATVTDTNYTQYNLQKNTQYSYYIMATSNDGKTSSSNVATQYTKMPIPPLYIDINYVKVINNSAIKLSYKIDLNADISKYELLRAKNQTNNFDTIYTFDDFTNPLEYTDDDADINKQYDYKLIAVNTCQIKTDSSEIVSNIVLNAKNNDDLTNTLQWNKLFTDTKESYHIYRIIDDGDTTQLTTIGDISYTDNISNYIQKNIQGQFCYYIEAQINFSGNNKLSKSNISCAYQMPKVYMPNAFSPNSQIPQNQTFTPAISFASPDRYIFIIYNRWGEKIFETKDVNKGWDGRYNGKPVSEGAYMYYIKFYTSKNKLYQKNGQITVFYH